MKYTVANTVRRNTIESGDRFRLLNSLARGRREKINYPLQILCANHSDEPLKAKIMSAKASIIFKSHLHCTYMNLERIFCLVRLCTWLTKIYPCFLQFFPVILQKRICILQKYEYRFFSKFLNKKLKASKTISRVMSWTFIYPVLLLPADSSDQPEA